MSIACVITNHFNEFEVNLHDVRTQTSSDFQHRNKPICQIIDELIAQYGNDIGIVIVTNDPYLHPDDVKDFKKDDFKKYGNLVDIPTKEELDIFGYFTETVEYSVGDFIIYFEDMGSIGFKCTKVTEKSMVWEKFNKFTYSTFQCNDFDFILLLFGLEISQVHAVFEVDRKSEVLSEFPKLYENGFKSVNFIKYEDIFEKGSAMIFAKHLISDPDVSILVKISKSDETINLYTIEDWGFIHIPQLIKEYRPRTDIMGIDFGATRSVLAVSRHTGIHVIPFDSSSPGDLWTESIVSFDEKKPLFGKAAMKRLRVKPADVFFDGKLLANLDRPFLHRKEMIWPFAFFGKQNEEPYFYLPECSKDVDLSLSEFNAIFLEWMTKAASEYQSEFNDGKSVQKTVITVPRYLQNNDEVFSYIYSTIKATVLANIEVIDIIEETHADLLYYLSNDRYSEMIKPGMKIAIFDIGGGTGICRIYDITQHNGKKYAVCSGELNKNESQINSGRDIDEIIINKLTEYIPKNLSFDLKYKTLEAAKEIKYNLSFEKKTEFTLSEIDSHDERVIELTREWFEQELATLFPDDDSVYTEFKWCPLPTQRKDRCRGEETSESIWFCEDSNIDIVFLAGGTCKIPFIQEWIRKQFPNAEVKIDGQLEIITATGAVVHALQVLSGEVEPYIKITESEVKKFEFKIKQFDKKVESPNLPSGGKDDDYNDFSSSNKETIIKHNQIAASSAPKNNSSEATQHYRKTVPEPSQEDVPAKKKFLLP